MIYCEIFLTIRLKLMKKIELSDGQKDKARSILKKYKTYSAFSKNKEDAFNFTSIIGIKVCPYCNIEYVYTVYKEKKKPVVRPDIDHFIPKNGKTGNPKLQLELTNLIPSCFVCNERLKGSKAFSQDEYMHPYFDDFDSIMSFRINLNDTDYLDEAKFEIQILPQDSANADEIIKALNNIEVFKLKERYRFHKDEVVMLFKRMRNYNTSKLKEIENLLNGDSKAVLNLSYLFPEKYCDINSTSLGKLKRDVLNKYLG